MTENHWCNCKNHKCKCKFKVNPTSRSEIEYKKTIVSLAAAGVVLQTAYKYINKAVCGEVDKNRLTEINSLVELAEKEISRVFDRLLYLTFKPRPTRISDEELDYLYKETYSLLGLHVSENSIN